MKATAFGRRATVWSSVLLASTMLTGVSAAFAQDTTVGEIIVTAQKRAEDLQDVPVSIQAIGGEKLEALVISDFNDYVKFLPSVSFQSTAPGFSSVYMRGVASGGDGNHSGSLPSVGIYLDEQPITTIQGALDVHVYDMERVEALAGPQGTLYGASSQAGTIRLITHKPEIGDFSGAIDTEVNSVSEGDIGYGVEGFVNVPVSDSAALRVVGWYQHDAGYVDNVLSSRTYPTWGGTITNTRFAEDDYNDVTTTGGRMALKIDLNEDWTVTPSLMGQTETSHGNFSFDPTLGDLKIARYRPESAKDKWYQAAMTVEGKIGSLDFVYAGSYMKRDVDSQSDYSDYSFFYDTLFGYGAYWVDDLNNPVEPTQYIKARDRYTKESHEIRLSTPSDLPLRVVGGYFFQNQTHGIEQRYMIDGIGSAIEVSGWPDTIWLTQQFRTDKDYALFGEVAWDFHPGWTLTGGVRYFLSENGLKGFFGYGAGYSSSTGEAACDPSLPVYSTAPCTNLHKTTEESGFTHRVNLTWSVDDDRMLYGTWSTGYRPGGINRRGTLPPYSSDFLTNYELGWKTMWFDRSVRWNGAIYLERWDDFQFSILGANGLTEIKNAAQARIRGLETDVTWRVAEGLTINGGAAWTQAELTANYCGFTDPQGNPVTQCAVPQAPKGTQLPVTPRFKGNVTVRYEFALGEYDAHLQGSMVTQTSSWTDLRLVERAIIGKQDGWSAFDFTAGVERDAWSAEFFVQNLTDERASLYRYAQCAESVCGGAVYTVPNQPRTLGLRLGRKF
ncbi:MAG TPA: TonB-dependent receptor [Caulobacter sp.]|nr:TonB-dependent receptor [Caulobacter sp.]